MTKTSDSIASMRISEFRRFTTGRFLFIMGLRMMGTVTAWWIYQLTKDPLSLGLIGLAEVIPAVSLALYAGHIVDKNDRRIMILRSAIFYALCTLILLLTSLSNDHWPSGNKNLAIGILYTVFFFTGVIRAFSGPSFGAIISQIVPIHLLANATTWSQGTWLSASVIGHALAGFLIAGIGITGSLIFITTMIVISLGFFRTLSPKIPPVQAEKRTWESVKEGIRFVRNTKEIVAALTLDLFAVLFGGAVALVPVFASDILKVGPIGFGWLNAAADFGAILIVFLLIIFPLQKKQGKLLMFAVAGFGLCMILFGASRWFWLSFIALFFSGLLDGISIVIRGTILQLKTPNHLRGRVMSVNSMFINSSNELGQFESGVAARLMGTVPSVIFGGCMTLAIVVITWFKAPELRKLEY
jgi:MFS family permease